MTDPKRNATDRPSEQKKPVERPEGPHARDDLQDHDKTPGTGSLPSRENPESDVGPD